ncbi:serine/threonine protein kinase [Candidatus Synechococcus calcipolaris G9]|uniref:non-specific serine/threonine protein kinase n=1 Tax=Candidatus Synechococcus calcipolaris G9 TaxID=1497997 RepID=A0ABT6EVG5_9SYNE|nr:serine/threonine-protein kinase [Candidatus Synechococcus calcipolaris]MDG2989775.1 serine/threonine protein kinase [Candidatus Synechococcus calcipolaris G9]
MDNRYYILRLLGTGGFGDTYLAKDIGRPSNPLCIIKHLKPASLTPDFLAQLQGLFHRQAEFLGRLTHHDQMPSLVASFEINQEFYIVHDYVEGHTMDREFLQDYRWTETQVTDLLRDVLGILCFAHAQGVVHGDLKPENLVRRYRDNRVVLVDFATVRQVQKQVVTTDGQVLVTISVSTPGYTTDTATGTVTPDYSRDIYAAGLLAIRALTGLPLEALKTDKNSGEIIWEAQALANFELEAFISRMVDPDPENRFTNAKEALRGLLHLTDFYVPESVQLQTNELEVSEETPDPPATITPTLPNSLHGELLSPEQLENLDSWLPGSNGSAISANRQSSTPSVTKKTSTKKTSENPSNPKTLLSLIQNQQGLLLWGGAGLLFLLGAIALVTGFSGSQDNQWQTVMDQAKQKYIAGEFQGCIDLAQQIPEEDGLYSQALTLVQDCRLGPAQRLEQQGDLAAALAALEQIPPEDPVYRAAQQRMAEWSDQLLSQANQAYQGGDLDQAVRLAQAIPEQSPTYEDTQAAIASWQAEGQRNQILLTQARQAFDQRNWQEAIALTEKVTLLGQPVPEGSDYWRQHIEPLVVNAQNQLATSQANPVAQPESTPTPGSGSGATTEPPPPEERPILGETENLNPLETGEDMQQRQEP